VVAAGFRIAVRQTIGRISERPENDAIIVLAIKHQAQDPASWPSGF